MRSFFIILALAAVVSGAAKAASNAPPPIPPDGGTIVNSNGKLSAISGPSQYLRVWKPFGINNSIDSTGSIFFPSSSTKTSTLIAEIDDDAVAAQVFFVNTGTSSYTITGASVSGSSQLAVSGYTGALTGVSAYDSAGSAITSLCGSVNTACWSPLSFGNAGAASSAPPCQQPMAAPASSVSYATSGSSTGTTLNFGTNVTLTGVSVGQRICIIATTGTFPALYNEAEYVTAVTNCAGTGACTVTIGPAALKNTVPSATTVYFLPLGITVPASTAPPVPQMVASDWVPVQTTARLDGYPLNGQTLSGPAGIANGTTVNGTPSAGSVPLSTPLIAPVASGTTFTACTAATAGATLTPNYVLNFSNTTGLVPGMQVTFGGNVNLNGGVGGPYQNGAILPSQTGGYHAKITSVVANTSVTLDTPLPSDINTSPSVFQSPYNFQFILPLTLTAPASSGATSVFVQTGLTINSALKAIGTNIPNATVTYNSGTGQLTFATGSLTANMPAGTPMGVGINYTNSSSSTMDTNLQITGGITNTHWLMNGGYVTGANISGKNWIWTVSGANTVHMSYGPTGTINSGQAVNLCHDYVTDARAATGATSLSIAPPKRLLAVRVNVGSANANYNARNYNAWVWSHDIAGTPLVDGALCSAGTDGVLSPSSISNTAGGCARATWIIPYMIVTMSPRKGLTVAMVNADSHFDISTGKLAGPATRVAAALTTTNTPVSGAEVGWGGQYPQVFRETARQFLLATKPDIVMLGGWGWNGDTSAVALSDFAQQTLSLANYVKSYGGVPIVLADYVRIINGCNVYTSSAGVTAMQTMRSFWSSASASGTLYFDPSTIADPTGSTYLSPAYSDDCVHGNDALMDGIASGVAALIRPYKNRSP